MQRRTLLSSLSVVGTVAIAGCSNNGESATKSENDSQADDNNGAEGGSELDGPERTVQEFIIASRNENYSKLNEVVDPSLPRNNQSREGYIRNRLLHIDHPKPDRIYAIDEEYISKHDMRESYYEELYRENRERNNVEKYLIVEAKIGDGYPQFPVGKRNGEWYVLP